MPARSRTSFQKRQKEIARMEKQRDKAARRAQRKLAAAHPDNEEQESSAESAQPEDAPPTVTE